MDNMTDKNTQAAAATQPEDNGAQQGRTFTQEEVNRIVSDRLARERAKAEPSEEDKRLADITARESKIVCNEFLIGQGYPEKVVRGMLDVFDTSDSEQFKKNVDKLLKVFPAILEPIYNPTGTVNTTASGRDDQLAAIFRPQK
jgi:adenylosuccinate synthase